MCSDSKNAGSFLHELVEMEEKTTIAYMEKFCQHYRSNCQVDKVALHFLLEAYVSALLEPVRHHVSREKATLHTQNLSLYFAVGRLGLEEEIENAASCS